MKGKQRKHDLFPLILLGGIITGAVIGVVWGEKAQVLKPLGDIFLNLMFTIVAPMVLVSISTAVGNMADMKRLGKILGSTMVTFVVTGLFAATFILVAVNLFQIVGDQNISLQMSEKSEEMKSASEMIVSSLTVTDFPEILSRKNMLPLIVFSVLFGLAVSANGGENSPVGKFLNNLNGVILTIISFIIPVGASTALGAFGYVECFEEILKQEGEMGISFHNIVLPVGSGGTYAGIWYGNAVHESKKNILGISVNHRKKFFEEIICKIIQEMDPTIEDFSSLQIIDNYIGKGYAQYREQELQEYYHIAKREGVLLDPCYTGKAFLGMCREIPLLEGNTLFIHTGGVFGWTKEMREELFKMIKKENKNV